MWANALPRFRSKASGFSGVAWPARGLRFPWPFSIRFFVCGGMNPNKALWEKGDFTQIAGLMRQSGETLVASLGVKPPLRALDLGCGDGTTAIPLARRGAEVVGIDIAKNLVDAGNQRSARLGLR